MNNSAIGDKPKPSARKKARRFALQALYQWQIAKGNIADIEAQFRADNNMKKVDVDYFHELLHKIPAQVDSLDQAFEPYLDRKLDELGVVEISALRIGSYELCHRLDVPYRVVINEAVDLAKTFGAEQSYRYVNGILDRLAKQVRKAEIANKAR